jgi:methionyl-tRNA synthetase
VRALVDRNAEVFRRLTRVLDLSNDDFIRTARDERHLVGVQRFWEACVRAGDVYRRLYRGLYCVRCERFYAPDELIDARCPEHQVPLETVEEENYFFRLSRYADRLAALLDDGALRVLPDWRHQEVRAFVARGLSDFSISRSRARARDWGIPVPGDPGQVVYVWFDALTNYVTALGYESASERYRRFWIENPHRVHVIGKDIVRFHAVYWPAMLLSAGAPPPTVIVVHGFLTRGGRRMSKTLGTGVDPVALVGFWGVDALRYWLLRVPPFDDAEYSDTGFARTYDADLANDLGNLLQRTVSMLHRYRGGVAPPPPAVAGSSLEPLAAALPAALHRALAEAWDPRDALDAIWALVKVANRLIEDSKPWALAREERAGDASAGRRLDAVLGELTECLRLVAEALRPLLPATAARIAGQLGYHLAPDWTEGLRWGRAIGGTRVPPPAPLFPRRSPGEAAPHAGAVIPSSP